MADPSFLDQYFVNPVQNAFTSLTKGTDISGLPYDAQAAALAKRQKMAELLMQQGQQQPEVMTYKGIAAQPSMAGGLGKALSQFMGAYMSGKAEEDAAKLEKTGNENFIKSVGNYYVDPGTSETKTPEANFSLGMPNIPKPVFDRNAGALVPGTDAGTTPTNVNIPAFVSGSNTPSHTRTLDERMAYDLANMTGGNKAQSTHFATQYTADAAKSQAMTQLKPQVLAMLNDTNTDPAVKNLLKNAFDSEDTDRLTKIMNTIDVNAVPKAPTAQELSDNRDFAAAKLLKPSLTRQQWNADNAGLTAGAQARARSVYDTGTYESYKTAGGDIVLLNTKTGKWKDANGNSLPVAPDVVGKMGSESTPRTTIGIFTKQWDKEHPNPQPGEREMAMGNFNSSFHALQNFDNPNGATGKNLVSINAVTQHLSAFKDLALAMKNGNVQAINAAKNYFAEQFGVAAPSNLKEAALLVSNELEKSSLGSAGTGQERNITRQLKSWWPSPDQYIGAINTDAQFVAGRANGLHQEYKAITKHLLTTDDWDEKGYLTPEAQAFLNPYMKKGTTPPAATPGATAAPGAGGGKPKKSGRFTIEKVG
jgi:hypothetical protein